MAFLSKFNNKINIITFLLAIGLVLGSTIQTSSAQSSVIPELSDLFQKPMVNDLFGSLNVESVSNSTKVSPQEEYDQRISGGVQVNAKCCGKPYYEELIIKDPANKDYYEMKLQKIKASVNGPYSITGVQDKMVGDNKLIFGTVTNNQIREAYAINPCRSIR